MEHQAILVAIYGGCFGFATGLAVALVNARANEFSKQGDRHAAERAKTFDLYATVFPRKLQATEEVMEVSFALFHATEVYCRSNPSREVVESTNAAIERFGDVGMKHRWLFSPGMVEQLRQFNDTSRAMQAQRAATKGAFNWSAVYNEYVETYRATIALVRQEMHLEKLEDFIIPTIANVTAVAKSKQPKNPRFGLLP